MGKKEEQLLRILSESANGLDILLSCRAVRHWHAKTILGRLFDMNKAAVIAYSKGCIADWH